MGETQQLSKSTASAQPWEGRFFNIAKAINLRAEFAIQQQLNSLFAGAEALRKVYLKNLPFRTLLAVLLPTSLHAAVQNIYF